MDANPGNGIAADANGKTSLRAAVEESNARGKGDVDIFFDSELADENGKITLELTQTVTITEGVAIHGDFGSSHLVRITSNGVFGQFLNWADGVSFNNLLFIGAKSDAMGGAIANGGTMVLLNCTFIQCTASSGGAVYNANTLTVGDSIFYDNSATDYGGAIFTSAGVAALSIYYTSFLLNDAKYGGGIASFSNSNTITNNDFFSNSSLHDGGGAYFDGCATVSISDTKFSENKSNDDGGALYLARSISNLKNIAFDNNHSLYKNGGAIYIIGGSALFESCDFLLNTANNGGGGALFVNNGGAEFKTCKFRNRSPVQPCA